MSLWKGVLVRRYFMTLSKLFLQRKVYTFILRTAVTSKFEGILLDHLLMIVDGQ